MIERTPDIQHPATAKSRAWALEHSVFVSAKERICTRIETLRCDGHISDRNIRRKRSVERVTKTLGPRKISSLNTDNLSSCADPRVGAPRARRQDLLARLRKETSFRTARVRRVVVVFKCLYVILKDTLNI